MDGISASYFGLDEVSGIRVNVEAHITGMSVDDGFWMC